MPTRRSFLGALAAFAIAVPVLAGCSSGSTEELPDAATLLDESAAATRAITSAHFTLDVQGEIEGITVQTAEGDLTRAGSEGDGAKGSIKLTLAGQLVEGDFVLLGETLYLQGPTGTFQEYPSSITSAYYDPTAILDPERGFAHTLTTITEASTEAREDVNGAPAYRVSGRANQDAVGNIVPGVTSEVDIEVWVSAEGDPVPVKVVVTFPTQDDGETPTVEVTLSDVGKPVTVTAPA